MLSAVVVAAGSGSGTPIINTPVVTAVGAVTAALVAGGFLIWQTRRNRKLEKEKIALQEAVARRSKDYEWEREDRLRAEEEEREQARAREHAAARRGSLVGEAAAYCTRLVQELSTLRILDMSRRLELDRLYVQVRVKEQEPLRYVREEELDQERTNAEARKESHLADAVHTYAPVDALQRYQRIVVVGDPGAGKTTMLRHLALCMAAGTHATSGLPELPAYVELFRFVQSGHECLLDYVAEHLAEQYGFADARDYVEQKLVDGSAALLLDGLDEVLGGKSPEDAVGAYHRVTEEVNRLATRFPRALIATTCRRHGWQGGLPQFQMLEALDFEWPQIETFIANWFGDDDKRSRGLGRALSGNTRLQLLAANPLLLSLIAIVYERDLELPERRAALYRRCVEVLLREWDAHRKIRRFSRFTTDRKQDLLKQIAWHYHERGQRYFREDDLLELIAEFLPTIDLPRTDNRAILDEIAAQYGLLKAQAHGLYGFLHLTLQEHFAAAALLEQGAEGIRRAVDARYDPRWEEVILLLAGSLPDATGLLLGVLQLEPGEARTREDDPELLNLPDDDLFHTDLLLAARCLTGSPRVGDVELRRQIVRTVWELLENSPYDGERRRAAEAVVGMLGSEQQVAEAVDWIGEPGPEPPRMALLDALGEHGGRKVGERLLGLLVLHPDLAPDVRDQAISALGVLRTEAAIPLMVRELAAVLERVRPGVDPNRYADDFFRVETQARNLIRSLGAAGGPADVILRVPEEPRAAGFLASVIYEVADSLRDLKESVVQERLLALIRRDNDWHYERGALATAYLDIAGDDGIGALLDIVRSERPGGFRKIHILAALVEHSGQKQGWAAYRDDVLALARDDGMPWQARWLALECLDNSPGEAGELELLCESGDRHVSVAAYATLTAWGSPVGLGVIRAAILDGAIAPDLTFPGGVLHSQIAQRLGPVLSPYGATGIAQRYCDAALIMDLRGERARTWLKAFDPDILTDVCLQLLVSRHLAAYDFPSPVPRSRVSAVLSALDARERGDMPAEWAYSSLLRRLARVADDEDSVTGLLKLIDHERNGVVSKAAHNAAHEASRRARVKVLPDHTIVSLP